MPSKGEIRIIAGQFRGRKIAVADQAGLRPTGDRVRETAFNWLMHDIHNANCLDAFAGSGAMGLEALSRGAKSVTFCETNFTACKNLNKLTNTWACAEQVNISHIDALQFLANRPGHSFELIFMDPPFEPNILSKVLELISKNNWLAPEGKIYLEAAEFISAQDLAAMGFQWLKQQRAGKVCFGLVTNLSGL